MQKTGRENRAHIGIYGRCNAGKSSLLNYLTDAPVAIVSPETGTTTDPVRKNFELLDAAPVVFIDTAGFDDRSVLGEVRLAKTMETLAQIDLAILVYRRWEVAEEEFAQRIHQQNIPLLAVANGSGFADRETLLAQIKEALPEIAYRVPSLFGNRVSAGDSILLVCPIDGAAPAGRLILPQVQALRELLDRHAIATVVQPAQLPLLFAQGLRPTLVVTDSQLFGEVEAVVPPSIEVTSFSLLLAAAKGDYPTYLKGLDRVDSLQDGDRILIVENCAHQVSCEDIGRVKIPRWLNAYSGKKLHYTTLSGLSPLPDDLATYALMVQCGGCMVTRSQLLNRVRMATSAGLSVTNYGMLIRKLRSPK